MDEIQVLIPVAVKSKLTEALKTTLLNQINQNIKSIENDMTQLEFEANAKLAEQAKINMQAVAPLRAQYDAQKAQMIQVKDKLTADKEHLLILDFGLLVHSASRLQSDRNWPVCRVVPRFAWHNIGFRCLKHVLRQGYGGLGPAHSEWQSC